MILQLIVSAFWMLFGWLFCSPFRAARTFEIMSLECLGWQIGWVIYGRSAYLLTATLTVRIGITFVIERWAHLTVGFESGRVNVGWQLKGINGEAREAKL